MKARPALALLLFATLAIVAAAFAYQIIPAQRSTPPASLTAYVPQDALLTIESPDFASLLRRWTNSAESKNWLTSDNYAVFQNSRLFGRLGDAQTSFAAAAGLPTGVDLLDQVAGKESVFAWYDIGKLEFLYITLMSAAQADHSELFEKRGSFERRHAGNADFYIRTSASDYSTVAFTRVSTPSGELVLLATREDLIANALALIAAATPSNSIQQEPWFRDVSSALPAENPAPALHMALNLDRIAVDPHFRSYWIQRNITWTQQFRAAASDLYVEPTRFREERVLLPKSPRTESAAAFNIASLAVIVPPATGVFRAVATEDPSDAVTAIQEKLLGADTASRGNPEFAPDPNLDTAQTGSASDLETRIDALPPASPGASTAALTQLLQSAHLNAVLTLSSAEGPPEQSGIWVPIHSAVVLHTGSAVNPQTLASALQQSLRGSLTAASIGIDFQQSDNTGTSLFTLTGPRPLFFAITSTPGAGNLVLLAVDRPLLVDLLHSPAVNSAQPIASSATLIAAFNHSSQRAPYLRLTSLIDGTNNQSRNPTPTAVTGSNAEGATPAVPAFFSRNIRSLSETFANLQSVRVFERILGSNIRQTITYSWQTP